MNHRAQASMPPAIDALRARPPLRRLPGRNATKADILVYRSGQLTVALKDYSSRPWWIRQLLGRLLVGREVKAYRAAAGAAGLPRFLGRAGPFALAVEWIEGRPLAEMRGERVASGVLDRLDAIVTDLHARGVALGDLHHRDVLVGASGEVHVVDLATAWVASGARRGPRAWIFERLKDQDRIALARLRARFSGGDPERAAAALGGRAAAWYRRGRRLKAWFDRARGRSRRSAR